MSIIETVTNLFGDSDSQFSTYRCASCENTFESYKSVKDVTCPDCLSHNVETAEDAPEPASD